MPARAHRRRGVPSGRPGRAPQLAALLVALALATWGLIGLLADAQPTPQAGPEPSAGSARVAVAASTPQALESTGLEAVGVQPLESPDDSDTGGRWDGGNLRLRVEDAASGRPLGDIRLSIYAATSRSPLETSTPLGNATGVPDAISDADGLAVLRVPEATPLRLIAYGDSDRVGQAMLSIDALGAHERREVRVTLPVGLSREYWARVVDRATGAPIEGAAVVLFSGGTSNSSSERTPPKHATGGTRTDADGRFVLRVAAWTGAYGRIEAPGYGPVLAAVVDGHATPADAEMLELVGSAQLAARVTNAQGGPLKGAVITLSAKSYDLTQPEGSVLFGQDLQWTNEIGWEGETLLQELPAGIPLSVTIELAGRTVHRETDALVLEPGESAERTWQIGGGALLTGVVIDQTGAVIPKQELWLTRQALPARLAGEPCLFEPADSVHVVAHTTTDEQGGFAFHDVPAGGWLVGPAARVEALSGPEESAVSPWAEVVDIPAGAQNLQITLRVARAVTIRGRVVGPDGSPNASRLIQAWPAETTAVMQARSDTDGSFVLGPLMPGTWIVQAKGGGGLAASDPVAIEAGATDIELVLNTSSTLRGHVVATGDLVLPSVSVVAWSTGTQGQEPMDRVWTSPDAAFQLDGLRAGSYDLTAHSGDGRIAVLRGVQVGAGETLEDLSLSLQDGAPLRIRYDGKESYGRFTILSAGSAVAVNTVHTGTTRVVSVPPGPVAVELWIAGRLVQRRALDMQAGVVSEVHFGPE